MKKKDSPSSAAKAATTGATLDTTEDATPTKKGEYRKGRVLIAGYFDPATKASLRMIQVHHVDKSVQDLMAEAFDDLFAKYKVPQSVRTPKKAAD